MTGRSILAIIATTSATAAEVKPYILFQIDTSGSMAWDVCSSEFCDDTLDCSGVDHACTPLSCETASCGNGVADDGRLWKVKHAVAEVVNAFGEATYALARFHQYPRPFLCDPSDAVKDIGGGWWADCTGADILVRFAEDNQQDLLDWVDSCDNWPTTTDCNPVTNLAPDTGCMLCADCGGGCDKELRPAGPTPLTNSLADDLVFMQGVMGQDDYVGCRPYVTILLTDGEESCSLLQPPATKAAELCGAGVPVYVIGFADPTLQAGLDEIADAGCGPGCDARGCRDTAIMVDNEVDLALAFADIIQGSVLSESCNGMDDDCDGLTDEDFPGLGTACCDPCPGTLMCNAIGDGTACSGIGPCPELCNALDDDCDGWVDEDIDPPCPVEVCNGIDDDTDGATDEDLADVGWPCGVDTGECASGTTCCQAGLLDCCGSTPPVIEACDCLDNNCNGQTDEGVRRRCYGGDPAECPAPESGACLGICRPGTQPCDPIACPAAPTLGPCVGWEGPRAESCNCLDDDCDALTDEDPCAGGGPCIDCACVLPCDPTAEFPCPLGYVCLEANGGTYCLDDPCIGIACGVGTACDPGTGTCVSLCASVDCDSTTCCDGLCCEAWEICGDWDGDGAQTCLDMTCTNPAHPCAANEVCIDHACIGDPCAGVECGTMRFCLDGACRDVCPTCATDERCVGGRCVTDPCAGKACIGTGVVCCDGECRNDPCAAVSCTAGQTCVECAGECADDPCTRIRCPRGYACDRGECLTVARSILDLAASGAGGCSCELGGRPGPRGQVLAGLLLLMALRARRAELRLVRHCCKVPMTAHSERGLWARAVCTVPCAARRKS